MLPEVCVASKSILPKAQDFCSPGRAGSQHELTGWAWVGRRGATARPCGSSAEAKMFSRKRYLPRWPTGPRWPQMAQPSQPENLALWTRGAKGNTSRKQFSFMRRAQSSSLHSARKSIETVIRLNEGMPASKLANLRTRKRTGGFRLQKTTSKHLVKINEQLYEIRRAPCTKQWNIVFIHFSKRF